MSLKNLRAPSPLAIVPELIFCADGRLHLYFTNRDTSDVGAPLTLVSHAAAFEIWDSAVVTGLFDPTPTASLSGIVTASAFGADAMQELSPCYFPRLLGIPCIDVSWLSGSTLADPASSTPDAPSAADMLTRFRMLDCDPVYITDLLGAASITDSSGSSHPVEVNDPNVYLVNGGEYVMIVHCDALGGLVRLTADAASACSSRASC